MRHSAFIFSLLLAFGLGAEAAPLPRSVSSSRQFIVYGTNAQLRGALCETAERTKEALLKILGQRDDWKTPIVVLAQYPQANLPELPPAALQVSQTGFGLKLQLDLTITAEFEAVSAEREFLRALLVEMMYRQRPDLRPGTAYQEPPDWLVEGILASRSDLTWSDVKILRQLAGSENVTALADFLRQRPALLDTPSREVYHAYATALLDLLTQTGSGRQRLVRLLADLPDAPADALADLQEHFPALGTSPRAAEKMWRDHLARLAAADGLESLSFTETTARLEKMLILRFPDAQPPETTFQLRDFSRFVRLTSRTTVLRRLQEELAGLGTRAHPAWRPVIFEYQRIAFALARGKTFGLARRLARLQETRAALVAQMDGIDDYLNWFEATQARTRSGNFSHYLRAGEASDAPRRHDAISVYLDAMENEVRE